MSDPAIVDSLSLGTCSLLNRNHSERDGSTASSGKLRSR